MDFISQNGVRFTYWVTTGDVINVKSWTFQGDRHHEIWIRNMDGREWSRTGFPLRVNLTRGQRIGFVWCSVEGRKAPELVAVQNFATGLRRVLSSQIAIELGVHRYGRQAFVWLSALAAFLWGADFLTGQSSWIPHLAIGTICAIVLGGTALGFLLSCFRDPDPDRTIDRNVQTALADIEYAWKETQQRQQTARGSQNR